jgi:hypothetical protein
MLFNVVMCYELITVELDAEETRCCRTPCSSRTRTSGHRWCGWIGDIPNTRQRKRFKCSWQINEVGVTGAGHVLASIFCVFRIRLLSEWPKHIDCFLSFAYFFEWITRKMFVFGVNFWLRFGSGSEGPALAGTCDGYSRLEWVTTGNLKYCRWGFEIWGKVENMSQGVADLVTYQSSVAYECFVVNAQKNRRDDFFRQHRSRRAMQIP